MVKNIASLGRNGVHDFLLIRASAVILTFYTIYLIGFFVLAPELNYATWVNFWSQMSTKILTMLGLGAVLIHAWIGLWQVVTDYIKSSLVRGLVLLAVISILFMYFFSGLFVLWGV